jgi:hypothetical protein
VNAPPTPPSRRPAQVPVGPLVASVGAVLLIVSLFLDWYDQISGFTVFEVLDLVLVALALLTIASLVSGLGLVRWSLSPEATLGVAVLALVIVASQVVNDPPAAAGVAGPAKSTGIWLALGASALMVAGSLLGYARISLAVEPRDR